MNILNRRWSRFKQELPSIILLSTIAIWDGFTFPDRLHLGAPWNTIYVVIKSSLGAIFIIYLFSSMDKFAPYIKLEHIKDTLYGPASTSKKNSIWALITGFSVAMFFMWYTNFCGMSNINYVFSCAYLVLMWALLYRAACRVDSGH